MRAAVDAGASLINSVWALRLDDSLAVAAELDVPVCLMHMQGTPATMQQNPAYEDVVAEVKDFLPRLVYVDENNVVTKTKHVVDAIPY